MRCSWEWSVFVRKHSQCCWARCVHVAHQSTHSCPLPQLSWKNLVKTVHFLSLRTMLVTKSDCRLRMENLFFSPSETQPHPFPPGSFWAFFFDQKRPGKNVGYRPPETIPLIKTIGLLRTQTLRENDGPIGIPIDDDLRQETLLVELCFLEDTLFAMRSNAKIDQCVETTPLWNWPKQARARFNYYWQTTLCCSFPTPPWCGSFSILCQKKMGGFIQTWPLRTIAVLTCVFPVRMRRPHD